MVRAGAEGGFMEEALERVADFTEKQEDLKSRTIGAIAYPLFLAVIGALVVTGLIIFVVPNFAALFERLRERGELPIFTDWLLWLSDTLRSSGLWIALGFVAIVFVLRGRLATEAGRVWRDRLILRVPVAGTIFLNLAVSRFCRVLGTLLHNGVPILKSLQISSESTGNRILAKAVQDAAENVTAGQALAGPLAACGYFPPSVVEMIAVAEESNSLESVLVNIADGLERRTWRQLDLFVRLLEPIMLLLLASVVLVVVIALLLPVIKMSTTI
jgi:general secretion pathway protein F/type IV pilus assembly protein PilC